MISTLGKCGHTLQTLHHFFRLFVWRQTRCLLSSSSAVSDKSDAGEDIHEMERDFKVVTIDTFADLIGDDSKTRHAVETILAEYEYEKYVTTEVPTDLTVDDMRDLLSCDDRRHWMRFLYDRELRSEIYKQRRRANGRHFWAKKRERYERMASERTGIWDNERRLLYGLWHNCLVSKIQPKSVKRLYSHRLRRATLFGQKLVIDMSFDEHMTLSDCRSIGHQIQKLYSHNKYRYDEPFDLHFTSCDPSDQTRQSVAKHLANYTSPYFVSAFHEKPYLDLFAKESLVYLSPHSDQVLTHYNRDDIYIIGGVTGKTARTGITAAKAAQEGIRSARLSIDEHIVWKAGCSKLLSLEIIVDILHDLSAGHEMSESLRNNIPKSCQKSVEEIESEESRRLLKYNKYWQCSRDLGDGHDLRISSNT